MAEVKSNELTAMAGATVPLNPTSASSFNARIKRFRATFDLDEQASGDELVIVDNLPKEFVVLAALVTTTVTLDTATLSIDGTDLATGTKTVGKYSAARTLTSVETPVLFGKTSGAQDRMANEKITATVGTAALPASGTLVIDLLCSSVA